MRPRPRLLWLLIQWWMSKWKSSTYPKLARKKGQGVIQCRVKATIKCGALRLYPYDGTILDLQDDIGRKEFERGFNMKAGRQVNGDFLLYSAMSHKSLPVATIGPNDKV